MPFYNDPYVREALESALAQTYKPLEIIVVNDGSERETDILYRLEGAGRIKVVHQPNRGTASALNAGFRLAAGHYAAWLSSDDRFRHDKIERQVRFMQGGGWAISHTAFRLMSGEGIAEKDPILLPEGSMLQFYRSMLLSNTVNGCTVMMERTLFNRMGGFNEKLPYTHDYELWLRTVLSGYPIGYLRVPLTDYRVHSAMGTVKHGAAIERELESVRNTYLPRLKRLIGTLEERT
ncbi:MULTISPECIES: glycosyltransferase [unclassified Cohnella]|uniref:glycosyltransferase family 2 protein n=1 Tax=unclassified Cohnella TaxID=2636738 RepID=UPI002100BF02|nr:MULTISPECIES: glycosyltransferase [unclassified Cohnella]